ncbi:MAG: DUF4340 domain-containing protein, partial [Planctomycetota bacterium]|nr:DUF4340 domain-containing protein [Planctomycetota bacterium]
MNEMTRTLSYVGVAVLLALGAIWVTPKPAETTEGDLVGTVLLPDLKDATSVEGLEVVSVDGTTKQIEKFKVLKGRLPSHEDYPADAEKQLVNAVSGLINLKVQDVVTKNSAQHAEYGVIEPKEDKVTPGAVGVGKLVNILGKSGRSVGKLVIGNEDKLTGGGASLRFVRLLPSDNVYRVALAGDNFTTKFENWIDTDLLKLETPDIAEVTLDDYSMAREAGGWTYDPRSKIILDFDDKTAKWDLKELLRYTNGNPEKVEVGPDQELNTLTLNDLKTALDELKIVDVRRKPKGISGTLTAKTMDFSGVSSLAEHGFYPLKTDAVSDEIEIMSSNGQISVQMKDGVQYLLRFGGVAGLGKEDEKPDAAKTGEEGATPATKLNRYIMVSAQFNKDVIPPPQLQPVPELPDNDSTSSEAPPSDAAAKSADGKAAEGKAGDAKSNDTKSKSGEESVGSDAKKLTADEREELVLRRKKVLAE